jgi:hypothetical protein
LRCERPSSFSVFLPCYLKGKYKRWLSIRPPCAECPRDAPPPLHYLHEHAWRRGPATPKDSPSHRTCTGDPPKQEKITSERARIIQHFCGCQHNLLSRRRCTQPTWLAHLHAWCRRARAPVCRRGTSVPVSPSRGDHHGVPP